MKHIATVKRNIFRIKRATKIRLFIFVQYFKDALTSNNVGGKYDDMLAALALAFDPYKNTMETQPGDLAQRKVDSLTVEETIHYFEEQVHTDYPTFTSKYNKKQPEYKAFFPKGLSEYNNISEKNFPVIIAQLITAITTYQGGVITAQMLLEYKAIQTNYNDKLSAKTATKSSITDDRVTGDQERYDLEDEMFHCYLQLMVEYYKTPTAVDKFYDYTLLFPHTIHEPGSQPEQDYIVSLDGMQTKDSGLKNIIGHKARFIRLSGGRMQFYTVPNIDSLDPGNKSATLDIDVDELEIDLSLIGDTNNPYLIIRNLDTDPAEVIIEWID